MPQLQQHASTTFSTLSDKEIKREKSATREMLAQRYAIDQAAIVGTTDVKGRIIYANDKFCEISGYTRQELLGQDHRIINSGTHSKAFFRVMYKTIAGGHVWRGEICNRAKDGTLYWVDTTIVPRFDANGKPIAYMAIRIDISAQKAAQARLRESERELEEALAREKELNELQRGFVTMASHEFRTPLAIIDGSVQKLKRRADAVTPEQICSRADTIKGSVQRIISLMDSVLSLAKHDNGQVQINKASCDIRKIVTDCVDRQYDAGTPQRIAFDPGNISESIVADGSALDQIFTNLLSNAVKYSPEDSTIEVNGKQEDGNVVFEIRDYGIGMDEDDQEKLFTRFFRAKTAQGISGTGIGLYVVKALTEQHGGSIAVKSALGAGTTFTLKLPINNTSSVATNPIEDRRQHHNAPAIASGQQPRAKQT